MCEVEAKTRRSIDTIVRSVPRLRRSVVNLPGGRYEVKEGRRVSGSERPRLASACSSWSVRRLLLGSRLMAPWT